MSRSVRTSATMAVVALSSWSCGSTAPDVTPKVGAIVVSPASSTITLNAQLPLQAEVRDDSGGVVPDAAITWTVEDSRIVRISADGIVTALAVGTSKVAANALGKSGNEFTQRRNVCVYADGHRLQNRIAFLFIVILREVTDKRDGDEVQHDRVDDFMRAKLCFQDTRNRGPERAAEYGGGEAERNQKPRRQVCESDSDPRGCEGGDVELAFGADVEESAAEADENSEAGEDQRRGVKECVADAVGPRQCAAE